MNIKETLEFLDRALLENFVVPGWSVIGVGSGFFYTLGLWENYGHPEIIVFGLPVKTAHAILNDIGKLIKNDKVRYKPDQDYEGIFRGFPAMFKSVIPDDHFGIARRFYEPQPFDALQLCWPDKQMRFPWDEDFDQTMRKAQPLLWKR